MHIFVPCLLLFLTVGNLATDQRITEIRIAANKPLYKFLVVFTEKLLVDQSQAGSEISHKTASYALLQQWHNIVFFLPSDSALGDTRLWVFQVLSLGIETNKNLLFTYNKSFFLLISVLKILKGSVDG